MGAGSGAGTGLAGSADPVAVAVAVLAEQGSSARWQGPRFGLSAARWDPCSMCHVRRSSNCCAASGLSSRSRVAGKVLSVGGNGTRGGAFCLRDAKMSK